MIDNEKLARWQGYSLVKGRYHEGYDLFTGSLDDGTYQIVGKCFDYPNDEAACGSLLDTLVERGFYPDLSYREVGWNTGRFLWHVRLFGGEPWSFGNTRREAIVAACLEVARKEVQGE